MARLGRSQPGYRSGHSILRAPTVVSAFEVGGPPVSFGPGVKLAPPLTRDLVERRRSSWRLSPPATLQAPALAEPLRIHTVRARPPRFVEHVLSEPQVVDPAPPVETQVRTTLARTPLRPGKSKLSLPQVVDPPAQPPVETVIRRTLAPKPQTQRYRSLYFGIVPQDVDPPAPLPPVETELRVYPTRKLPFRPPSSRLAPPATLEQPAAQPPVNAVVRVNLAVLIPRGYGRHRKAGYGLAGPMIVSVFANEEQRTLRTYLVPKVRPRRAPFSELRRPQVVGAALLAPVETELRVYPTERRGPRLSMFEIRPPTVVSVPTTIVLEVAIAGTGSVSPTLIQQQDLQVAIAGTGAISADFVLEKNLEVAISGLGAVSITFVQQQDFQVVINGVGQVLPTLGLLATGEPRRRKQMGWGL